MWSAFHTFTQSVLLFTLWRRSQRFPTPASTTPSFYLGDPNATFRELRENDPLHWYERGKFWVITKYDDIKTISARPEKIHVRTHRDHDGPDRPPPGSSTRRDTGAAGSCSWIRPNTAHTARRSASDSPRRRSPRSRTRVQQVIASIFDGLPDGEFDWIERIAEPFPVYVFAHLLGVPEADWAKVAGWATTIAKAGSGVADDGDMEMIFGEIAPYLMALVAERANDPTDDLLSMLTQVRIDGEPFNEIQVMTYAITLLAAGSETTQSLIAGIAACFDMHPEQAEQAFADPEVGNNAVEEVMRWWTPVMSMARQAAQDVEIRGATIREGDGLLLAYASANRDAEHWGPTAEQFDVHRPDAAGHVGFGVGEHFCMGAALARREARVRARRSDQAGQGITRHR